MYTYIVVDDESLIRKGTIKKLEALRSEATCIGEAANGEDALSLIRNLNPDLIITDMNMPVLDGTQFLPLLNKEFSNKQIIVISGYKDFAYTKQAIASQAVDYILKPFSKEEIQISVKNAIDIIESKKSIESRIMSSEQAKENARFEYDMQLLRNLILGYHTDNDELTSSRLNFINKTHHMVMVTMHSSAPLEEKIMQAFLSQNGFGDLALYLNHLNNNRMGFLILFVPEKSAVDLSTLLDQILQNLTIFLQTKNQIAAFGISHFHAQLQELNKAFLESVDALNTKNPTAQTGIYEALSQTHEPLRINWERRDEFLFRVEAGMLADMHDLLDELFLYFTTLKDCTLYDVKYYCFALADEIRRIMTNYIEHLKQQNATSSMQNLLNSMFSLEEINMYYEQFFTNITLVMKEQSVFSQKDTIEKIKIYIQKNYQKNLTVEYVSYLFYLNRSYLSHLFKEKTGEKFVDYVNHVRIEKAKQLLVQSDKKMYQISKAVGYDNVKYFFRIFKKIVQVTPDEYRKVN